MQIGDIHAPRPAARPRVMNCLVQTVGLLQDDVREKELTMLTHDDLHSKSSEKNAVSMENLKPCKLKQSQSESLGLMLQVRRKSAKKILVELFNSLRANSQKGS